MFEFNKYWQLATQLHQNIFSQPAWTNIIKGEQFSIELVLLSYYKHVNYELYKCVALQSNKEHGVHKEK